MKIKLLYFLHVAIVCTLVTVLFQRNSSAEINAILFVFFTLSLPVFYIWVLIREVRRRRAQERLIDELARREAFNRSTDKTDVPRREGRVDQERIDADS